MQCDALQNLGEEKLENIIGQLVGGVGVKAVARTIQEDWRDAQGLTRGSLERELTSLRLGIKDCGLADNLPKPGPRTTGNGDLEISPVDELTRLAQLQKKRVGRYYKAELAQGKPLPAATKAIKTYTNMLIALQKMRFEVGLDEYKRVKLTPREQQAAKEAYQAEVNEQVYDAVGVLKDIMKKRRSIAKPQEIQ